MHSGPGCSLALHLSGLQAIFTHSSLADRDLLLYLHIVFYIFAGRCDVKTRVPKLLVVLGAVAMGMVAPGLLPAISLEETLARVDDAYEVRIALSAVDSAARAVAALAYPGSLAFSATPGAKGTSAVGRDFAEQVDLTGAVSLRLPVGLSAAAKDKLEAARATLAAAQAILLATRASTYARLYGLYQAAWLANTELEILEAESEATRLAAGAAARRYEAGELSLAERKRAEEDFLGTQTALLQGGLRQRLSWLELTYATGREKYPAEDLAESLPADSSLPRIVELVDWAQAHHPSVIEQRIKVGGVARSLATARKPKLELDARLTAGYQSHAASVSFASASPQLSATYSFPIATFGEVSSGPSPNTSTWSLGLSAGLSLEAGKAARFETEVLEAELKRETERLESLLRTLELGIRSHYQQWLKARDGVEQAQRAFVRAREIQLVVEAKLALGQASETDLALERAAVERGRWNLAAAAVAREKARLAAAEAAGYLAKLVRLDATAEGE